MRASLVHVAEFMTEHAPSRLGHAADVVSTPIDTYSHAIPAMQEEANALIAGLVSGAE